MFTPVDKKRAFEAVVEQIEDAIYRGDYAVGDYLPSERALVEEFGVGRSTVREALRILESMGLVKTNPGSRSGPQVCSSVTSGLTRMLEGAVRMEQVPLVELVQYRMIAGSAANHLAANLRSDEQLDRMRESIERMRSVADGNASEFAAADEEFHKVIREASGNSLLTMVSGVIKGATIDLVAATVDRAADTAATRKAFIASHEDILAAIADRNGDRAGRLARESLFEAYAPDLQDADRERLRILVPGLTSRPE